MMCENCGKQFDIITFGSGRFCCEHCAKQFSSKQNTEKTKVIKCIRCGKEIIVSKNSSINQLCNNCKMQDYKEKLIRNNYKSSKQNPYKRCNICGKIKLKNSKCKFCEKHNIQQLKTLIKYFGFDKTKLGTSEVELEFNKIKNKLYDLYWNKHLSSTEIANKFNYPFASNLVNKVFNYLDIKVKSVQESVAENFIEGRASVAVNNESNYKAGWHTTWNNKQVYLRSSYELDYANYLDNNNIDYEVEFKHIKYYDTVKHQYRCAIPDFYLTKTNTIVEIKSNWTLDIQNMKDKKLEYLKEGYNFKLILEHKETII